MDSDDDTNEERVPKKHKKKKKPVEEAPLKIGKMKAKLFTSKELTPFERVLWREPIDHEAAASTTTAALRKRLGLKVPDVRRTPCKFWLNGSCSRGEACSFAHDNGAGSGGEAVRCPPPVLELVEPGLPQCFGRGMLHLGHLKPSPIQAQAWPAALCGHDLLCRAPTGSGKTLAYLLPAAAHALAASPPPKPGHGPICLVLAPTRELAMQIAGQAQQLRRPCGVRSEAVYGGEPREDQVEALEGNAIHILVATTGRLVDMLMAKVCSLSRVTMLILDEADQLLALGFSVQVSQVLSQVRPDRQTLCFSATLSERLEMAAGSWLRAPMRIYADPSASRREDGGLYATHDEAMGGGDSEYDDDSDGEGEGNGTSARSDSHGADGDESSESLRQIPRNIEQRFVLCDEEGGGKAAELLRLLESLGHSVKSHAKLGESVGDAIKGVGGLGGADGDEEESARLSELQMAWHESGKSGKAPASGGFGEAVSAKKALRNAPRVMCFVNEIKVLKRLAQRLRACGVRCEALHGEKSQRERDEALKLFKAGAAPVLLTSDLGSRGLDVARLPAVVNYDPPTSAAQYVHRAGRTGRQGAAGLVVSLLRRDAPSRHLAAQVRGMLKRSGLPLPPALASLLPTPKPGSEAAEAAEAPKAAGKRRRGEQGGKGAKGQAPSAAARKYAREAAMEEEEYLKEDATPGGGMMDLLSFAQSIG